MTRAIVVASLLALTLSSPPPSWLTAPELSRYDDVLEASSPTAAASSADDDVTPAPAADDLDNGGPPMAPADGPDDVDFDADLEPLPDDSLVAPVAIAGRRWTPADVLAVLQTASLRARCIVTAEVGGVGFNPYAVGRAGERGPVQLHPRGLLGEYLAWSGGAEPENPVLSIAFLEHKLAQGQGRHWSPVLRGMC